MAFAVMSNEAVLGASEAQSARSALPNRTA